jgi:NitT/TauT family transport system ATP-binding protein
VIFVTHDLGEAIALADRVVLLGGGRVLDDVTVGIDRPRDLPMITSDHRYQQLYERLREQLH